jgi:hypothetical protein
MPGPRAGLLEDRLFSYHPIGVMELAPARSGMVLRDERRHMGEMVGFQGTLPAGQARWPMLAGRR